MSVRCKTCYFCNHCTDKFSGCADYTPFLDNDDYEDKVIAIQTEKDRREYYSAYQEYLDIDNDVVYSYI